MSITGRVQQTAPPARIRRPPSHQARPIRRYTRAQTELATRAFAWILAGMDDEEVVGTIRKSGEKPIDVDDTRASIEDFGPALLAFATRSLRSRAAIVAYAKTLVETVGIVRQKEGWGRRAWELSDDFHADMKEAGEVKDEAEPPEGRTQKVTPKEGDLLINMLSPIFGKAPSLGEEPPKPGVEPKDRESEEYGTWKKALRTRQRWLFIRDWNKNFPRVVIDDDRNAVMTSLKLVELMLTPEEWSVFQDERKAARDADKAARAEASAEPAPEEETEADAEELSDEDELEETEAPAAEAVVA